MLTIKLNREMPQAFLKYLLNVHVHNVLMKITVKIPNVLIKIDLLNHQTLRPF